MLRFLPVLLVPFVLLAFVAMQGGASSTHPGLYPFQTNAPVGDSAGSNPLIFWSTLEPQRGVFNWTALDNAITAAQGKRIVPRIYTNVDCYGSPTPPWFFALPGVQSYHPSACAPAVPVSLDPVFQHEFGDFLSALGARYDGSPVVEYWQINVGGVYGEMLESYVDAPQWWQPGHSVQSYIDASTYWIDQWKAAFPHSSLAIMLNDLGPLTDTVADYAIAKGLILQANTSSPQARLQAIFRRNPGRNAFEIEEAGTGATLTTAVSRVTSEGFEVDYLFLVPQAFTDPATVAMLPTYDGKLRHSVTGNPVVNTPTEVPSSTPTNTASATSTVIPPIMPTSTDTPTAVPTSTNTMTPTVTATSSPSPTPSPIPDRCYERVRVSPAGLVSYEGEVAC